MLLNIDKPLKRATLHNEFCALVPKPCATRLKPVGRLGRDGGWFYATTDDEARGIADSQWPQAHFHRCPQC